MSLFYGSWAGLGPVCYSGYGLERAPGFCVSLCLCVEIQRVLHGSSVL